MSIEQWIMIKKISIKNDIVRWKIYTLYNINFAKDWFIRNVFVRPYYKTKIWFKKKLKLGVYYDYTTEFPMDEKSIDSLPFGETITINQWHDGVDIIVNGYTFHIDQEDTNEKLKDAFELACPEAVVTYQEVY